ncbi:MAG: bifunctional phosphopantothenoylcysteine decarboxylase/phosphopantothenate--cysteine ligase CoaBC [Pelagibacterales bacterium]|nr:bifunctional phosphopantothenoylcysteine decarboxylase/phosphopantothenate--cysteine ligase CoaBC [Pelagibacterales bacterium]
MNNFENKKILLIICGGIAAYKSLEIIRLLKKKGALVKTILTKNAHKFVTPLSVTSLSQEKIYSDLFDHNNEAEMDHISLSRWSDLILIAPATANTMSKISYGTADDLASTVVLASDKQVFLAPAMNVRMWEHPSNKDNLNKIRNIGYKIIGPEIGDMACGEYGEGKMTEPEKIIKYIEDHFKNKNEKYKALVTAGPTQEYIDPVRYITNKSSGKQGYAIAKSLKNNGFKTTLVSGPTNLDPIPGVNIVKVNSAKEMLDATLENLPTDVAIFSAAVADYKASKIKSEKIKKGENLNLSLEKNVDILGHVSKHNSLRPKLVIGFAAETNELVKNSQKKLLEKNCDWIIANDISNPDIGFDSEYNEVSIFYKNMKNEKIPKMKKLILADEIVKRIISQIN